MDPKAEAQAQIELILSTLKQVENLTLPKKSLLTYAVLIALIPLFEWGLGFIDFARTVWVHLIFYTILFVSAREFLVRKLGAWKDIPSHPVATRALVYQQKFAIISGVCSSIALAHSGYFQFIFPIVTLHIASLFYSFGKFSSRNLRRMAYIQVAIATISIEVFSVELGTATFPLFTTALALTFLGGALLR